MDLYSSQIYLAGESFAGQYIPYIARAIQLRNQNRPRDWKLSGLIIGNGWIDGQAQYPSHVEYAKANKLVPDHLLETVAQKQEACLEELEEGGKDHVHLPKCSAIIGAILMLSQQDDKCFNTYDVRQWDDFQDVAWAILQNCPVHLRICNAEM
jgi:carboxypeptidase D